MASCSFTGTRQQQLKDTIKYYFKILYSADHAAGIHTQRNFLHHSLQGLRLIFTLVTFGPKLFVNTP